MIANTAFMHSITQVTRKQRWCKGKRATEMLHHWRPLMKKSTANQRYAIFCWFPVTVCVPWRKNAHQYQSNLYITEKCI